MKVIIKNLVKETVEFIECTQIKLDKERLVFFGNRVISIFLPERENRRKYFVEKIEELFFNNQNTEIIIEKGDISIKERKRGGIYEFN